MLGKKMNYKNICAVFLVLYGFNVGSEPVEGPSDSDGNTGSSHTRTGDQQGHRSIVVAKGPKKAVKSVEVEVGPEEKPVDDNPEGFRFDEPRNRAGSTAKNVTTQSAKSSAVSLSEQEIAPFRSLHAELMSARFQHTLRPVLVKLCDVDEMTKLVSDIIAKKGLVDDMQSRCADMLKVQIKSVQEGKLHLKDVKVTPALRQEMARFMQTCKPLFDLALPQEPILRDSFENIVRALPVEAQENLCSTAAYNLDAPQHGKSNKMITIGIVSGMVALNLCITLLILFGNHNQQQIAEGMIMAEMVLLGVSVMGHSGGKPLMMPKE